MKDKQIPRRKFLKQAAAVGVALPLVPETLMAAQEKVGDGENADGRHLVLWYDKPASQWVEAAPIGNGRLGAMVFGGVPVERLQLNEDTLYAGGPYDPNNREALQALPEARRLILEGKFQEAHDLVGSSMMANPIKQMPYQPVGDLRLECSGQTEVSNYRRELNLDTAIARISYGFGGATFNREIFVSSVDQVIVVNLTADRPGQISFAATFISPQKAVIEAAGSHTGEIHLLPALPKAWPRGTAKGLRARGGFEVDIVWKNGRLTEAVIRSVNGTGCKVRYADQILTLQLKRGASRTLRTPELL